MEVAPVFQCGVPLLPSQLNFFVPGRNNLTAGKASQSSFFFNFLWICSAGSGPFLSAPKKCPSTPEVFVSWRIPHAPVVFFLLSATKNNFVFVSRSCTNIDVARSWTRTSIELQSGAQSKRRLLPRSKSCPQLHEMGFSCGRALFWS